MSVGIYFETWSSPWTSDPTTMNLSQLPTMYPGITTVNLSFAQPNLQYAKGQHTFANTGLQFSQDFSVVVAAIKILTSKGIKVMLSVGGGSYWSSPSSFNAQACVDLMNDLGCTGVDVDWEVGISDSKALTTSIIALHNAGCPRISFAGFSTGAYGAQDGDTYKGMSIDAMINAGQYIDWINIMSYDAGSSFDPLGAFTCYRIYYKGQLNLGFEPGTQSWGDKIIKMTDVDAMCNWVKKDGSVNGVFIWSNMKDTTGSPSLASIVAESVKILGSAPPVSSPVVVPPPVITTSPTVPCPNCSKALKITLA